MPSKFSEASFLSQLGQIFGVVAGFMAIFGTVILYAADNRIDQKYATDEDLLAVQETVEHQVTIITESVAENTTTVRATASSVDALTLAVLGLQISDLEAEISLLEQEKRDEGAAWNERDERNLRDRQRTLDDLERQRAALLDRLVQGPGQ